MNHTEESRMMLPLRHSSSSRISQIQEGPSSSSSSAATTAGPPANSSNPGSVIVGSNNEYHHDNDPAEKNKGPSTSPTSLRNVLLSTLLWFGFGVFGWYFPRFLIYNETTIAQKQPPYQLTSAGDVIVDFELDQPWVHPATVDSTYRKAGYAH
jgi:hypothetical protein